MSNESPQPDHDDVAPGDVEQEEAESPDTEELEEPSTEKPPGQEPKSADQGEPEPSHEAVGIGVIGAPLVDPENA